MVKAAQDRMEEMQGQLTGLHLKVSSLQGIVSIQEQQLLAAAGQSNGQASNEELLLLLQHMHSETIVHAKSTSIMGHVHEFCLC